MSEQEHFKSIWANSRILQQFSSQYAETQKIMRSFQTSEMAAIVQSLNITKKMMANSLAFQSDILKSISNIYFATPMLYDKAIFSSAKQGVLALESTQAVLRTIGNVYSSELAKMSLNIDWQKIAFSSNPTLKIFNELLVAVEDGKDISCDDIDDMSELPEQTKVEIKETFRVIDAYILALKEKIPYTVRWLLNIALTIAIGVIINKLSQSQDNSREVLQRFDNLTMEMRLFRESFTQNMPKDPKGYLRKVTRIVKFTTRDNHTIWLNPGDEIIVECDIKKRVYGTIVIDGKFIKGHCLKKYTKKVLSEEDR